MRSANMSLAIAALFLASANVHAASNVEPARVQIVLPECATLSFDAPSFQALVLVELAQLGAKTAAAGDAHPVATIRVDQIVCSSEATRVTVTVIDALTQKVSARSIELAVSTPSARSRVLAIASAELLRASWLELHAERERAVVDGVVRLGAAQFEVRQTNVRAAAPTAVPSEPQASPPASMPFVEWRVAALADTRLFLSERGGLFGASINIARGAPEHLVDVSAKYSQGDVPDALGRISLGMASLAGRAAARWGSVQSEWSLGPTLEAGYAWCSAAASPGAAAGPDGRAFTLLVGAAAEFEGQLSGNLGARLRVELGQTLMGLDSNADTRRVAAIHGAYVGVGAGLRLAL